jgi:hypothetical protein
VYPTIEGLIEAAACGATVHCTTVHYMGKSEVYSWRLSPRLKAELEEAASAEQKSVAQLLEQLAEDWLERSRDRGGDDRDRQQRIREAATKSVGAICGDDTGRAEDARFEVRSRLARRHDR